MAETILVAEDSGPNRAILSALLKKLGFIVIECRDGDVAWTMAQKHCKNLVCIFSDLMMPNSDGLEFLGRVRSHPELATIPFVIVSAVFDTDYVVQAKRLSVNAYLLKPITFQKIITKLQDIFPTKIFPKDVFNYTKE